MIVPYAPVQAVQSIGQWKPVFNEGLKICLDVGIKNGFSAQVFIVSNPGLNPQAILLWVDQI